MDTDAHRSRGVVECEPNAETAVRHRIVKDQADGVAQPVLVLLFPHGHKWTQKDTTSTEERGQDGRETSPFNC